MGLILQLRTVEEKDDAEQIMVEISTTRALIIVSILEPWRYYVALSVNKGNRNLGL
jgi:hypothetical protein